MTAPPTTSSKINTAKAADGCDAAALAIKKGIASRQVNPKDIVALTVEHGAVAI